MGNDKKIIAMKKVNGVMQTVEAPSDPIERLEAAYIDAYGELPFTSHGELEEYMTQFTELNHRTKTKLKNLREDRRITLPDMALLLGISKDGYFKIESGVTNPKLDMAFKIAKLLGTTVDELFGV